MQLDLQREYRVSSIEHNSGVVRHQRNDGIDPALLHHLDSYLSAVDRSRKNNAQAKKHSIDKLTIKIL